MKNLYLAALLFSSCVARHHSPFPQKWFVTEVRGSSFQVAGHKGWYRLPQGDTSVHKGDTLYINYPDHKESGNITRWRTR